MRDSLNLGGSAPPAPRPLRLLEERQTRPAAPDPAPVGYKPALLGLKLDAEERRSLHPLWPGVCNTPLPILLRPVLPLCPPAPPPDPLGKPLGEARQAAKDAAEQTIQVGDSTIGRNLVDTKLEDNLLDHWIQGSGTPYTFNDAQMQALAQSPAAQAAMSALRNPGTGGPQFTPVTLADGRSGYRATLDFNPPTVTPGNPYDGSLGRVTATFDASGHLVGVHDVYDFSNDSAIVDGINVIGAGVGARDFEVSGGVLEQGAHFAPPSGPDGLDAAESLTERGAEYAGGKVVDGLNYVGGKVEDGAGFVRDKAADLWHGLGRLPKPW